MIVFFFHEDTYAVSVIWKLMFRLKSQYREELRRYLISSCHRIYLVCRLRKRTGMSHEVGLRSVEISVI